MVNWDVGLVIIVIAFLIPIFFLSKKILFLLFSRKGREEIRRENERIETDSRNPKVLIVCGLILVSVSFLISLMPYTKKLLFWFYVGLAFIAIGFFYIWKKSSARQVI